MWNIFSITLILKEIFFSLWLFLYTSYGGIDLNLFCKMHLLRPFYIVGHDKEQIKTKPIALAISRDLGLDRIWVLNSAWSGFFFFFSNLILRLYLVFICCFSLNECELYQWKGLQTCAGRWLDISIGLVPWFQIGHIQARNNSFL